MPHAIRWLLSFEPKHISDVLSNTYIHKHWHWHWQPYSTHSLTYGACTLNTGRDRHTNSQNIQRALSNNKHALNKQIAEWPKWENSNSQFRFRLYLNVSLSQWLGSVRLPDGLKMRIAIYLHRAQHSRPPAPSSAPPPSNTFIVGGVCARVCSCITTGGCCSNRNVKNKRNIHANRDGWGWYSRG